MKNIFSRAKNTAVTAVKLAPEFAQHSVDHIDAVTTIGLAGASVDKKSKILIGCGAVAATVGIATGAKVIGLVGMGLMTSGFVQGLKSQFMSLKMQSDMNNSKPAEIADTVPANV